MCNIRKHQPHKRILIIVKQRTLHYDQCGPTSISSGLKNSAAFVVDMLVEMGHIAKLVEVVDNNCIDREVNLFNPDIVVIEALWVVPSKFDILKELYPDIKWIVRLHSDIPFIANEGVAMEWIFEYIKYDVFIGVNSVRIEHELKQLLPSKYVLYLPNFYPLTDNKHNKLECNTNDINIGCFGAIRPMKNQLLQAVSAIIFANDKKLKLRFHINGVRCENKGDTVLKNLRALFLNTNHELVEHSWLDHEDFLKLIATMDISMQCSLSETFNIVSCDAVSQGVPIVVSPEVSWANSLCMANATDSIDIVKTLKIVWSLHTIVVNNLNHYNLMRFNKEAKHNWKNNIGC